METSLRAVYSFYVTTTFWLGRYSGADTDDCSDRAFLFSLCPGKHFCIAFMLQKLWLRTLLKMWPHPTEQPACAPPSKNTKIATVKQALPRNLVHRSINAVPCAWFRAFRPRGTIMVIQFHLLHKMRAWGVYFTAADTSELEAKDYYV